MSSARPESLKSIADLSTSLKSSPRGDTETDAPLLTTMGNILVSEQTRNTARF